MSFYEMEFCAWETLAGRRLFPGVSMAPEVLEPRRRQLGAAHGVLDAHFAGGLSLSVRERQVDVLNLHRRQLIEAALICLEAIGRTEAHSKVAMKDQAK
jgi:hypothetical protein